MKYYKKSAGYKKQSRKHVRKHTTPKSYKALKAFIRDVANEHRVFGMSSTFVNFPNVDTGALSAQCQNILLNPGGNAGGNYYLQSGQFKSYQQSTNIAMEYKAPALAAGGTAYLGHNNTEALQFKYLELGMVFYPPAGLNVLVRIALVYDRETRGTLSPYNVVFNDHQVNALPNRADTNWRKRYTILWDKTLNLMGDNMPAFQSNDVSNPVLVSKAHQFKKHINLKNLQTNYSLTQAGGVTNLAPDIDSGALVLYIFTDTVVAPTGFKAGQFPWKVYTEFNIIYANGTQNA